MKRPFRLEVGRGNWCNHTFATLDSAKDHVAKRVARGQKYRIVERRREMGTSGREREVRVVVAEGVA